MKPESFRKLTYTSIYQQPWVGSNGRRKTEWIISSDGKVIINEYKDNFHKPVSTELFKVSKKKYENLCCEIVESMESFERYDMYVDDCCGTLTIYLASDNSEYGDTFDFGRIILDRGFGNGETDIGSIMFNFFSEI